MGDIINYWYIFVALYPGLAIILRGLAEGLIIIGKALNKPEIGSVGSSIGAFILAIGKIVGYFGVGTPKSA
jgi:hypothetical protein